MAKKSTRKAIKRPARAVAKASARKATSKRAAKSVTKSTRKRATRRRAVASARPTTAGAALVGVSPSITVNDVAVSLAWYRDVLGFRVVQEWKKNGQLTGAEMKSAAVTFYINQDDWKQGRDRIKGQGIRLFVTTGPDIDGYADAIKDRGGVLAGEPASEWGVRAFAVNDPDGFKLTFMTPLS